MPRQCLFSDEQIATELRKGIAIATIGKICHCHPRRVSKVKLALEQNGEKIELIDKRYKGKRPEQTFIFVEGKDLRNHKEGWIEYMENNPFYFKSTFEMDPTIPNIIEIAEHDETIVACLIR